MTVKTGIEVLRAAGFCRLKGQRVGLLTNPSAVDHALTSTYRILTDAPEVQVTALFGPEHGFAGTAPDAEHVSTAYDPRTGLPVFSLYGDTYRPTADMLRDVDVLVCDIQDVGVRYYTYTWTVSHVLEAAGGQGVAVMILDRPNPLNGRTISGPLMEGAQSSFVGRFPVPVRHGMTLGEIAALINTRWNPTPAPLEVVSCTGWDRGMAWADCGLPWIPPSPNMPHLNTLDHYPGACLVEGTTLSEGRGTALPFQIVGAPWIDGQALADQLNDDAWLCSMGARFRPLIFRPTTSKWAGEDCGGVQVHITDRAAWRPLAVWLAVLITIRTQYPDDFRWKAAHFDRLIGLSAVRGEIEAGIHTGTDAAGILSPLLVRWEDDCASFAEQRAPFLRYH